jgi:hypothetical protein
LKPGLLAFADGCVLELPFAGEVGVVVGEFAEVAEFCDGLLIDGGAAKD